MPGKTPQEHSMLYKSMDNILFGIVNFYTQPETFAKEIQSLEYKCT